MKWPDSQMLKAKALKTNVLKTKALQNEQPSKHELLQGVTLETIVTRLQEKYGWQELGRRINIKCFTNDPSVASSLKFLRRTPWARQKVEDLYCATRWDKP